MTPLGLARKISKLPERAPITQSFENVLTARGVWILNGNRKNTPPKRNTGKDGFRSTAVEDTITARTEQSVRRRSFIIASIVHLCFFG